MLLEFSVAVFSSIGEKQTLTFNAFRGQRIKGTKYEDNYITSKFREAKSAVLFGGNAVGKTNLLFAARACIDVIKTGALIENKRLFNYNKDFMSFDISLSIGEREYVYSLSFDRSGQVVTEELVIDEESVYQYKNNILTSSFLEAKIREIYSIPSTSTLLSKIKDFIPEIYRAFRSEIDNIVIVMDDGINFDVKKLPFLVPESTKKIIEANLVLAVKILSQVDRTITSIKFLQQSTVTEEGEAQFDIAIVRKVGTEERDCSSAYESKGIKRILCLLGFLIDVCKGKTLLVDELDASISTRSLLLLYNNIINASSNHRGQLIVTSHNLGLFDIDIFAPEQIFIANKNENLETIVHSLADFSIRKDKKRLVIEYLQGRFEV